MAMFRTGTGSPFPVGTNPVSNAAADLDGDGDLDLLTANYISDNASVLLNDGHGVFVAAAPVAVTNGPREIEAGDLDGDGDIDFIATNYSGDSVSVRLNNGNGTFTSGGDVAVGVRPRGLALGDLDGDGDLDFVAANYLGSTVSVMLNDGHAAFASAAGSPVAVGTRPTAVALGDFDGDHDVDIAVTNNSNNNVSILLNDGHGGFVAAAPAATGASPRGIASGDFDGDGDIDLAVDNFGANTVSILLNDGAGVFTASPSVLATQNNPYAVTVGDLDGDGDLDLATTNSGNSSISVFLNDGHGAFTAVSGSPYAVGVSPGGVVMADFDNDGDLDLSTANFGSSTASILINTAARYSVTASTTIEGTPPGAGGELVFTVHRSATSEAEDVTYILGGTATAGVDYVAPSGTVSFAIGQADVEIHVAVTPDDTIEPNETVTVTLTAASGEGTVDPAAAIGTILDDDAKPKPSDFNGDGRGDIFWQTDGGQLAGWEMNGVQISFADFTKLGPFNVGSPGADWHIVDTGDFDGDGKSDLMWRTDGGALAIWEMDGTHIKAADFTRIGSTRIDAPGADWHVLGAADFDGDGKSDLLWRTDSGALAIWQMDGTQIVGAGYTAVGSTTVGVPAPDWHIVGTSDFDGDGKSDLLWRTDSGALAIWEMNGTQIKAADYLTFGGSNVGAPGRDWHVLATGDFDGDGKGDLLWQTDGGALAIWEMNGTQIKAADYIKVGPTPVGVPGADWHFTGTTDYDGDGKFDLLWRTDGGAVAIWQMDGTHISSADYTKLGSANVGAPGSDWHIFQHHYDLV